jgi:hypothetical protein
MTSTWSNLGLNLQGTGDNSGTWGQLTNVNLQDIDTAISGVAPITLTGNTTLAFTSNSSSTTFTNYPGLNKIIVLSGSLSATTVTVTVPNIQKDYVIVNNSGATVVVSSGGSTTISIPTSTNAYIYSNGSSSIFFALPLPIATNAGGTTNQVQYNNAGAFAGSTNLTFNGTTLAIQTATVLNLTSTTENITTANITTANVTTANITSLTAVNTTTTYLAYTTASGTTASITNLNVTTANINTANVTTLKVTSITIYSTITATSVVTSASLVPTGVTSGSYTSASITVGSDGRITAASSGSAGGGSFIATRSASGPASGTHTASPSANKLSVFLSAGGGGGGASSGCGPGLGGTGGNGGYGFFNVPISQPFSQPFSIGAGGNGVFGYKSAGTAGGNSNLTNVGTVNGGNGGLGQPPGAAGSPGNAPGATYSTSTIQYKFLGSTYSQGGIGSQCIGSNNAGSPGTPGILVIYENIG